MAADYVFQIDFDPGPALKYISIQDFPTTRLMIEGSYNSDYGTWRFLGKPDPYFPPERGGSPDQPARSGTARILDTGLTSPAPECIIQRSDGLRIATLKNFSYDVAGGEARLEQGYLDSVWRKNRSLDSSAHPDPGKWTTIRHQYAHGADGVAFMDDAGNSVLDRFGNIIFRPVKIDAKLILREAVGMRKSLEHPESTDQMTIDAGMLAVQLSLFFQGRRWDAQRLNGKFQPEFIDYATVVIGIYFCGLGSAVETCLDLQNRYAYWQSQHASNVIKDSTYTRLPARNVANTRIGYDLVNSGRIKP